MDKDWYTSKYHVFNRVNRLKNVRLKWFFLIYNLQHFSLHLVHFWGSVNCLWCDVCIFCKFYWCFTYCIFGVFYHIFWCVFSFACQKQLKETELKIKHTHTLSLSHTQSQSCRRITPPPLRLPKSAALGSFKVAASIFSAAKYFRLNPPPTNVWYLNPHCKFLPDVILRNQPPRAKVHLYHLCKPEIR